MLSTEYSFACFLCNKLSLSCSHEMSLPYLAEQLQKLNIRENVYCVRFIVYHHFFPSIMYLLGINSVCQKIKIPSEMEIAL